MPDPDARLVQRQAFAGMLWSKQFYMFDVRRWLDGDPGAARAARRAQDGRNSRLAAPRQLPTSSPCPIPGSIPGMPPGTWRSTAVTFALIDPASPRTQLLLLTRERYMHPNGQLPAYEWAFGDVNPPVHAWAVLRVFQMDRTLTGEADRALPGDGVPQAAAELHLVGEPQGRQRAQIFQGGFLGLDNIAIFDRSQPLPTGGTIDQSDGTAWMAMFTLNMMRIALELALDDDAYEDMAIKFFEHFLLHRRGHDHMPAASACGTSRTSSTTTCCTCRTGETIPLRVRSIVGLIPLFAVEVIGSRAFQALPEFGERMQYVPAATGRTWRR